MRNETLDVFLTDESQTGLFAEDVALALARGDCLCLSGELGAGKTTFARALIRAIADEPGLEVPSPTFTLVQTYDLRLPIGHFDLYRLQAADELDELGLDDTLSIGVALVEWPERAGRRLPDSSVTMRFDGLDGGRSLRISAPPSFLERLARSIAVRAFLDAHGHEGCRRRFLQGDASARAYEKILSDDSDTLILMNAPARPDGPPVQDNLPYSRIAHLAEDVAPFVAVAGWLRKQGLSAPEVYAADLEQGLLLIENLGTGTMLDPAGNPDPARYMVAIECLAALHEKPLPGPLELDGGRRHEVPAYDETAMMIEAALLLDWYLPWRSGEPVSEPVRKAYFGHWRSLFARLSRSDKALVLRDYHSPNLIWRDDREGLDRIGIIDFQDAVIGPAAYDVASLVQDARVSVPPDLARSLLARYEQLRLASRPDFDIAAFREAYAIMAAQRAAKILGIFVRLDKRDGKPAYLGHLPRIEAYIAAVLDHEVLHPLRSWFEEVRIGRSES